MNAGHVPFYYVDPSGTLSTDDARHFLQVMRGRDGDPLEVADGAGRAWKATARVGTKRSVRAERGEELPAEPPPSVALAFALPKGQRVSYLIEKSVELGVSDLYLIETRFCAIRESPPGLLRRLRAVAAAAGMQARHPRLPVVHGMESLEGFLQRPMKLAALDASGRREEWDALRAEPSWTLLVGPEGGWAPEELEWFGTKGLPVLPLTRHPLRMETAAAAGLAFYYALRGR